MKTMTSILTLAFALQFSIMSASAATFSMNEGVESAVIVNKSLVPATPKEATFEETTPEAASFDFSFLTPVLPAEADFEEVQ